MLRHTHKERYAMFDHDTIVYMAGIIDGEGSLQVEIQGVCASRKTDYYSVRLIIINTDKNLMDWLVKNFGGKIHLRKLMPKRKQCYHWAIFSSDAEAILKACLPYMIVKKPQAKLLIEFMHSKPEGKYYITAEIQEHRRFLYKKMKELNHTYGRHKII